MELLRISAYHPTYAVRQSAMNATDGYIFKREYWVGDSRDGVIINGDGYHFFRMLPVGLILEAYEMYENEEGDEVVTPLPEMNNVHWINDLGFKDLEDLDEIDEREFSRIKKRSGQQPQV
ncbi:MAG: hypothetical protein HYW48_02175 [Deltaproteobacteria bacterium]|nr:hypothetical protein [Deltaproteobacteria bacterium]